MTSEIIRNLIKEQKTPLFLTAKTKSDVLKEVASIISQTKRNLKEEEIFQGLMERELKASTGVDLGVAIPHTVLNKMNETELFLFISEEGIDFNSLDSGLSHLFFVILSPAQIKKDSPSPLKVIAEICRTMRVDITRNKIKNAKNIEEIIFFLEKK